MISLLTTNEYKITLFKKSIENITNKTTPITDI